MPLRHGAWKQQQNHLTREDGPLLQFAPPEHVQSQMERLVMLYAQSTDAHPVVRAAWLHHRFVRIHPFGDGNGRVARALTLLVLLRARYAPLVVDRTLRAEYIGALDRANDGEQSRYWRSQLIRTARQADFYTNLSGGSWWVRLHLAVLGATMRYVVAVQKVGHGDTGVLAVTAFAETVPPRDTDSDSAPTPLIRSSPDDSVTLIFSDDADARWDETRELVDRTLAASVDAFARQLG